MKNKEYPEFLYKNKSLRDIPVFCYHFISAAEFEAHLQHLQRNGYATLTADEFYHAKRNGVGEPIRSAVLTFDDGDKGFYDVVFPLLKKYRMKAVNFIIPGWVGKEGMLTWEQIREMHQSGLVDIQSHSMHHPAIFVSAKVIDFYHPGMKGRQKWNMPVYRIDGVDRFGEMPPLGSPIFEFDSRFSDHRRFLPDEKVQRACQQLVQENGETEFFADKSWREKLFNRLNDYQQNDAIAGRFESSEEQAAAIRAELEASKQIIEKKMPGKTVQHFACPWNITSKLTQKLLAEVGYKTSFVGIKKVPQLDDLPEDFLTVNRISGDFVRCLPGDGRKAFWKVILSKIMRRMIKGATY
ncbi:MAG: polysaccharide deacetylase family protein [candidate division KSB1 bacterium]|nr:polysaccharide deacetylase family protein [candidate division KSB1 bacterium]MDZ7398816.1 polysaccharide deacetylase family protein [candidate division KSB1 bacterium]